MSILTRKTRNRFKEHTLRVKPGHQQCTVEWINGGKPSTLFECRDHCDWLGWVAVDEFNALCVEQQKGDTSLRNLGASK
jgi:hypothetical protein